MSLIICPECQERISNKTKACPKCGYTFPPPPPKTHSESFYLKRTFRRILIVIIVILVLFALSKLNRPTYRDDLATGAGLLNLGQICAGDAVYKIREHHDNIEYYVASDEFQGFVCFMTDVLADAEANKSKLKLPSAEYRSAYNLFQKMLTKYKEMMSIISDTNDFDTDKVDQFASCSDELKSIYANFKISLDKVKKH